jgi:hypothetical protein
LAEFIDVELKKVHKTKKKWSEEDHNNRCFNKERLMDKIVRQAIEREAESAEVEKKLLALR